MSDTSETLTLGGEYPPADHDEWVALAEKALRGRSIATLRTTTLDDIVIEPLYTAADVADRPAPGLPGAEPFVRGATASGAVVDGWDIRQHFAERDPAAQNDAVLAALTGGITSVWLRVDDADDLPRMLEGVLLDLAPVALDAGHATFAAAKRLVELWQTSGASAADIGGSFRADPIGLLARTGVLATTIETQFDQLVELVELSRPFPTVRALAVDAATYGDAGASDADEVACSLAAAVAMLRALSERGVAVDEACAELEFTYTAGVDQFATVAKLRAARRLWARVAEVCGADVDGRRQVQHAVSAGSMLTRRDPWVNLLRVTIATFAAGVAGADAVTAAPFDAAIGVPDALGQRMARNTQALLLEESNLARVMDPAGGSWYVESLTDELARAAWARFQAIEAAGGIIDQLRSGALAAELEADWQHRLDRLSTRASALTGVSEFPDLAEATVGRQAVPVRPVPSTVGESITVLPRRRLAAPFEALRDAADGAASAPEVFCASLGPLAVHTARTSWATNFFAAGGIRAVGHDGFADGAEAAAAFAASGSELAVICSSDEVYAEQAVAAASALKHAGARRVYLAGNPGDARPQLEAAGVDEFIHVGVDVLDALQRAHATLGLGEAS